MQKGPFWQKREAESRVESLPGGYGFSINLNSISGARGDCQSSLPVYFYLLFRSHLYWGQLGDPTADWTFHVGYYRDGIGFHIDTHLTPSFNESAGVWTDMGGVAHIFIGGNIDIPTSWTEAAPARTYTGTANITFTCGS